MSTEQQNIHKEITDAIKDLKGDIKELRDEVAPVVKWFDNINFAKAFGFGALKLIAIIVGLILSFKQIMTWR